MMVIRVVVVVMMMTQIDSNSSTYVFIVDAGTRPPLRYGDTSSGGRHCRARAQERFRQKHVMGHLMMVVHLMTSMKQMMVMQGMMVVK